MRCVVYLYCERFVCFLTFFFFNDTATTEIYTLSLHDALPICEPSSSAFAIIPWEAFGGTPEAATGTVALPIDRKSTRLNSSHSQISYAVFCLKKKKKILHNFAYDLLTYL